MMKMGKFMAFIIRFMKLHIIMEVRYINGLMCCIYWGILMSLSFFLFGSFHFIILPRVRNVDCFTFFFSFLELG